MLEIGLPDHIDGSHMMISSCPLLPQQQTFERTAQSVESAIINQIAPQQRILVGHPLGEGESASSVQTVVPFPGTD
jgi:hypothetical protein